MTDFRVLARVVRPRGGATASGYAYQVGLARGESDVRSAQRLRYEVFGMEQGARLPSAGSGLDADGFDGLCDHLLVRDEATAEVVGTYRLLPPGRSERLVAESEFALGSLAPLRGALVEAGRACVRPEHRHGWALQAMWAGILRYMTDRELAWICGCTSLSLADGGARAAAVWEAVRERHRAPAEYQVHPRTPWLPQQAGPAPSAAVPSLLRGYLALGAWVCGPPALDSAFRTADLFTLLSLDRIPEGRLRPLRAAAA